MVWVWPARPAWAWPGVGLQRFLNSAEIAAHGHVLFELHGHAQYHTKLKVLSKTGKSTVTNLADFIKILHMGWDVS